MLVIGFLGVLLIVLTWEGPEAVLYSPGFTCPASDRLAKLVVTCRAMRASCAPVRATA